MYAKCGEIKCAEDVFNESIDGNVASWTSLMAGYMQNDCVEEEVILFNKMRDGLVAEANLVSWTTMIIGYTQLGHPSKALKLLVDKRWIGILPKSVTTASVLSASALIGHFNMGKTVHCLGTATASSWMDKQGRKSLLITSFSGMATSMLLLPLSFTWKVRGDHHRNVCSIPVSAHGTNLATAARCGMKIVSVGTDAKGNINMEDLRRATEANKDNLSALMVTYPSTHGIYEEGIDEICEIIHGSGSKLTTFQLVKSLILTTWGDILSTAFFALLYSLASYVGPHLIDTLVHYLDGGWGY
ncbi:hypothetical protein Nepgr_032486 [Nepenthes gracilis]|uniref:Pentatricopeptide repeat-containing protein n=1 Tax=Nepenthes gracilis TaxID=150966 RepID=A0AAD3Y632_NEPGR|nr:hypothetical protein Nepgr_032486 [Nepenthes gracilis]